MFRLMFCVLIALLLPACDQGGLSQPATGKGSSEAPEANATT